MRPASDYAELCFHALAHLPLHDHTTLREVKYLEWASATLPDDATRPLREDAAVLAALYAADPGAEAVHGLPVLFASIAALRAVAVRPLAELAGADVAEPEVLDALRRADERLVEALYADLALIARAYEALFAAAIRPEVERGITLVTPYLEEARRLAPALAQATVYASLALGARGRALGERRLFVGVPTEWNGVGPAVPAVLALHEQAVCDAARDAARHAPAERYTRSEWSALVTVAKLVRGASADLRDAHAAWLCSLDLAPLATAAAALGLCPEPLAHRIAADPTLLGATS